ncbi:glycine oxidase ThiO [Agilicoccus flavus]|uniref:glycine oxidase ThiO n=1 Tax=Agilicoccus flavus TaxID=2775968 RepID=UPI001CF639CE|nr:glycine oxidase ThiO [Agilicoccus flavus]
MRVNVIGGGVVGLSVAWRAAEAGASVTVIDPDPAGGATRAAAGMLAPVGETSHREDDLTLLLLESARRFPEFAARVGRGDAGPTGFRDTPTLIVGADAADRDTLTALHDLSLVLGLATQRLTTREARAREVLLGPGLSCAFLAPHDHQVDPRALAAALLADLQARGEVERVPAVGVTHTGEEPSSPVSGVDLADGRHVDADAVVVANGVGAAELAGLGVDLAGLLRPVYGDVIRLDPPPHLRGLLSGVIRAAVGGRTVYLVPRADGSVVLGATSREDGNPAVSAGGVHDLLRDAIRLVPAVAEFALTESLARARPGTPDNAPLLGPLGAPGLFAATGLYRHGVVLAPVVAEAVAHGLGLAPEPDFAPRLAAFDPARFAHVRSTASTDPEGARRA